jgi:hypothetical protein
MPNRDPNQTLSNELLLLLLLYIYRASNILSNSFGSRLYGTLVFLLPN